jgi:hypothetical protein
MTKEILINNYMKDVDGKNISVSKIKEDLKTILHEEPFIELEYETEYVLNEVNKKSEKKESLTKVKIFYSEINTKGGSDIGHVVEYLI